MKEVSKLPRKAKDLGKTIDEAVDKSIDKVNELIDAHNLTITKFNLSAFDGQIIQVSFSAGEDKVIPHKLGKMPSFRIILRQEGNGVLSDTPSGWNQYQIKIKNNGSVTVTATIMLLRE